MDIQSNLRRGWVWGAGGGEGLNTEHDRDLDSNISKLAVIPPIVGDVSYKKF